MAGLKLQAVTKSWDGKTQVIKPLTLDVADGEFIVMVGPSGWWQVYAAADGGRAGAGQRRRYLDR